MSGLPDLARDLSREYRITTRDALEVIQYINGDIVKRLARGETLHIDLFGSFHCDAGKIWFNPSKHMKETIANKKIEIRTTEIDNQA